MRNTNSQEMIDFVQKTTLAITVISEATKGLEQTTSAIKEMINAQNVTNATAFKNIDGKVDGLQTMFKYVIVPLVAGILALVGVKFIMNI